MRKLAILICILGILNLLFIFILLPAKPIHSPEELNLLLASTKVSVSGFVTEANPWGNSFLLKLDNGMQIISNKPYLKKNISILGLVDDFNDKKLIKILWMENVS